ncbi:MAG: TRAP transporter permease [Rhodocyclaceae bacterium]
MNDSAASAPPPSPPRKQLGAVGAIALAWSLFQLWVASPLPIETGFLVIGETRLRSLHLAFALLLAFMLYPARAARDAQPGWTGVATGAVAAACAGYLFLFYRHLAAHPGEPGVADLAAAVTGLVLLLEATRRLLGLPMVVLVLALLAYTFLGPYAPDLIAHKGATLGKAMSHLWLSTGGVFGVALGVSAGFIFLFVLFGALLERAGGATWLVRAAVSLVGHMRGGPAKAAVGVSAATGLVSGSSITNVVTTGPMTIPLIKRVGFPAEKAAAVEVASSVNGQVMPPVMGAAAFLMVEYVGIAYIEVLRHALISALISYLGLLYIVHLESVKAGLRGLPRIQPRRWQRTLIRFIAGFAISMAIMAAVSTLTGGLRQWLPSGALGIVAALLLLAYLALLRVAAPHQPDAGDADAPLTRIPLPGPTLRSGLHFLLPIGLLVWNLVVERLSPTRAAFWATLLLMLMVATQRPLLVWLRGEHQGQRGALAAAARQGLAELVDGLISGARMMVAVAVVTATAGIVVGTVTLTGIGLVMADVVEHLSGGNVLIMLVLVAMICLVLGMGLPTTANYIVVSSLMAPVIVTVGAHNGVPIPLIAAHLFVFYFGLLADVLPPIGLATYAAASIAGANPLRTGVVAFRYTLRMTLLPFMFVLNPQLLLIGVHGPAHTLLILTSATLAGLVFIAVNQNWLLTRNRPHERLLLLIATLVLLHPGMVMNRFAPAYIDLSGPAALEAVQRAPDAAPLRMVLQGTTLGGRDVTRSVVLPLGVSQADPLQRLASLGITVTTASDSMLVTGVRFGSHAARLGFEPGLQVTSVQVRSNRPREEWMFLPALALIAWVAWRQKRRGNDKETGASAG